MGVISKQNVKLWVAVASVMAAVILLASCAGKAPADVPKGAIPAAAAVTAQPQVSGVAAPPVSSPSASAATSIAPAVTPLPLKLLKASPEKGFVGSSFSLTGEGLTPNKDVSFLWATWQGSYSTDAGPENVRFLERKFSETTKALGKVVTDGEGRVSVNRRVPEDYGEIHDIYAAIDGQRVAKGGFRVMREASITPTEGPVGTPITITVKGIGWKPYENTMALLWDNRYTGLISAVTTNGTAVFNVRAAGPVGEHTIQTFGASPGTPYLNLEQSPVSHIAMNFTWNFTVTADNGSPANTLDWPDRELAGKGTDAAPRTTARGAPVSGVAASLNPASGPILTETVLRAEGITSPGEVEALWVTARGNRVSPTGWSLQESSLGKAATNGSNGVTFPVKVPDDLGGWHVIKLVKDQQTLAEVPYFIERSLVEVSPKRVKAGEKFTLHIKGVGWTELDNGAAITYDNSYIGFVCGFNSNGDVAVTLSATGGPGTHLIDFYPMIYRAKGTHPGEFWDFFMPLLTALRDQPGLALGYKLPIFRLAVEVVE